MKKTLIRKFILLILAIGGIVLVFSEEQDENISNFIFHVIFDKALGFGCLYLMNKLYSRWSKTVKYSKV